jgi:hypothetical protein
MNSLNSLGKAGKFTMPRVYAAIIGPEDSQQS